MRNIKNPKINHSTLSDRYEEGSLKDFGNLQDLLACSVPGKKII